MLIGFNFTLGETLPMLQRLRRDGDIDYVELLIDNFLQVQPSDIARQLDMPRAFHIMLSRYLDRDEASLRDLARRLKPFIDTLQPLYVSDHVAHFSHRGRDLFHLAEIDYEHEYLRVRQRVSQWQDMLGCQLLIENYPSIVDGCEHAPAFYLRLAKETGCGCLFDFSNALCAQKNTGVPLSAWEAVMARSRHFHVAAYNQAYLAEHVTVDSHDGRMADDILEGLAQWRSLMDGPGHSITYERDEHIEEESIRADLRRLRALYGTPPQHPRPLTATEALPC